MYILCLFPFYCYVMIAELSEDPYPNFTYIVLLFFGHLLFERYKNNEPIYFPFYLKALGIFVVYEITSSLFLTDEIDNRGLLKIILKNEYFGAFFAFFLVENIKFSLKLMYRATYLLIIIVIIFFRCNNQSTRYRIPWAV